MGIEERQLPHPQAACGVATRPDPAGLAAEIETRLAEAVPDAAIAISQPIEMRTNELVAGVKSDVAAALYGPDLSELKRLGEAVERALQGMAGVAGLRVEPSAGLNYLRIYPDRARLARYGLSLDEVSELTQSLAAGVPVGQVFGRAALPVGGEGRCQPKARSIR